MLRDYVSNNCHERSARSRLRKPKKNYVMTLHNSTTEQKNVCSSFTTRVSKLRFARVGFHKNASIKKLKIFVEMLSKLYCLVTKKYNDLLCFETTKSSKGGAINTFTRDRQNIFEREPFFFLIWITKNKCRSLF